MLTPDLVKNKNVLFRADLDVPIAGEQVANDYRLQALLPSLKVCLSSAKSTLIIGHLGRPEGYDARFSLNPVRKWLENALHQSILFIDSGFSPGEWARGDFPLAMFDNLRFHPGELSLDREFSRALSADSDIYVYEAFAAYNSAASLQIIPELLPTITGLQFDKEVTELSKVVKRTAAPSLLIISGAKEDKRKFVADLLPKFDEILVGGRLASLVSDFKSPKVVTAELTTDTFDISPSSIALFREKITNAKSVCLNGPLGRFEDGQHTAGTREILAAVKSSSAYSLLGGGDTLSAIVSLGFAYSDFDFVSTGGGAMLEFLSSGTHPLLEIIKGK